MMYSNIGLTCRETLPLMLYVGIIQSIWLQLEQFSHSIRYLMLIQLIELQSHSIEDKRKCVIKYFMMVLYCTLQVPLLWAEHCSPYVSLPLCFPSMLRDFPICIVFLHISSVHDMLYNIKEFLMMQVKISSSIFGYFLIVPWHRGKKHVCFLNFILILKLLSAWS